MLKNRLPIFPRARIGLFEIFVVILQNRFLHPVVERFCFSGISWTRKKMRSIYRIVLQIWRLSFFNGFDLTGTFCVFLLFAFSNYLWLLQTHFWAAGLLGNVFLRLRILLWVVQLSFETFVDFYLAFGLQIGYLVLH